MAGYRVRCALEEDDSGDVRFDKLCKLIAESDRTIHDLSRTASDGGYARFNMPFELGLMMGARRFGTGSQKRKQAIIMVTKKFEMPRFLSDLAGNDPKDHADNPENVIRIIRDHLHTYPAGKLLPGAEHVSRLLNEFRDDLPTLAKATRLSIDEVDPYRGYRNFMSLLEGFRDTIGEIADSGIASAP